MTMTHHHKSITTGHVDEAHGWVPFEWEEPSRGHDIAGEIVLFRTEGSGKHVLLQGLWRTHKSAPGADPVTGAHTIAYSAPLGDENIHVVEGSTTVTNRDTGEVHRFTAGDIFSISKGTDTYWEIEGPSFKKYFGITGSSGFRVRGCRSATVTGCGS
jgi:uncharacterized cupin superfamily protein